MKKNRYFGAVLTCLIFTLIIFSKKSKAGALDGLELCSSAIIPSLLPILILTNTITLSGGAKIFEKIFAPLFKNVLKLNPAAASAVFFGLIGGYPAGALLTEQLHKSGVIGSNEAVRIMRFNFCAGGAFTVTAVGTVCYGSTKLGLLLYAANLLSEIIIALAGGALEKKKPLASNSNQAYLPLVEAMPKAIENSIKSILTMCGYIVLFSAASKLLPLPDWTAALIEITNGLCGAENPPSADYCAFFLAFGGLCVHFQLLGIIGKMKMKYGDFFFHRLLSALISFFAIRLCPEKLLASQEVFSTLKNARAQLSSANTALSVVLVIGCAVMVLDIENKKSKLL